ncbi:integrase [Arthrobacter sp. NyZ413]|uniref:integrase n=1 Tax=Arthrobacter sp. NyZ413 TaxID=3144669 RepID=UPI002BF6CA86|nr:integrase [Arthrobacter sp.]
MTKVGGDAGQAGPLPYPAAAKAGAPRAPVLRIMLGHSSAAMTPDIYADLFDGDLESVSDALNLAVSQANVSKTLIPAKQKAPDPL